MKISMSGDFAAPADQVFAVIADEQFQTSMVTTPGSSATVESRGDRTVITSVRVLPTDGLPDFARTFVGDTLTLSETQDWGPAAPDGTRRGTLTLAVAGAPLTLNGTLSLAPNGTGSTQHIEGDLRARVPLVGGKIENSAAPALKDAMETEFARIRQRL